MNTVEAAAPLPTPPRHEGVTPSSSLQRPTPPRRGAGPWVAGTVFVGLTVWSAIDVHIDIPAIWRNWGNASGTIVKLFQPDYSFFPKTVTALVETLLMAVIATAVGSVISLPLAFLAARNVAPVWVRLPIRLFFAILRAVPEVVIAILILSVTGLTAFTGALALGVGSMGTLGKWGYEAFESQDPGPLEAVRSTGGTRFALIRWGLWPQAKPEVLAFWLYRFEIAVRSSAILGLIGAGGIGKMLTDNTQYRIWDAVGMLLIVVVVVTMVIDQISGTIRQRIITGRWGFVGWGRRRRAIRPAPDFPGTATPAPTATPDTARSTAPTDSAQSGTVGPEIR